MCAVSTVMQPWTAPRSPGYITWSPTTPDPATAEQMLKVIELLEMIDKKLSAKDCALEAKDKAKFKAKLKRRAKRAQR